MYCMYILGNLQTYIYIFSTFLLASLSILGSIYLAVCLDVYLSIHILRVEGKASCSEAPGLEVSEMNRLYKTRQSL